MRTEQQIANAIYPPKVTDQQREEARAFTRKPGRGAEREETIEEIADKFNPMGKAAKSEPADQGSQEDRSQRRHDPMKRSTDEELAARVYPAQDPDKPKTIDADDGTGKKQQAVAVRDLAGLILHQAFGMTKEDLANSRSQQLTGASLHGMNFNAARHSFREARISAADASQARFDELDMTNVDARGADFRGASMRKVRAVNGDFREALFDAATDVTGMDITGAVFSDNAIRKAKGFKSIIGSRAGRD